MPGRLEKFTSADGVLAVVDYAHTDDAVRKALTVLRGITRGRLLAVLGCGGNRDAAKRPLMARAAVETADYAILTADNPRLEKIEAILDDMVAGITDLRFAGKFENASPIVGRRLRTRWPWPGRATWFASRAKAMKPRRKSPASTILSTTGSWCGNF